MKLLIITQILDRNDPLLGFFHEWIREFAKQFKDLIVICLQKDEYNLPKNVKVLSLGKKSARNNLYHSHVICRLALLFRFYKYIYRERKNYDAVFIHMNQIYVILGSLFWKLWKKKISLWYAHGHVDWRLKLAERITNIIFTSTKEGFRIKSKKVKIVGQGIDIEKFKPIARKENYVFKIISISRISPSKDCETLIKAIKNLKNINFEVEIIGGVSLLEDENYLKKLKKLISEKGLGDAIKFLGPKPNKEIIEYLQSADLFVNMSQTGSLDKAVLEAMACRLPVLTCNEALGSVLGKYGEALMYPKKDFKTLAEKIDFIINLNAEEKDKTTKDLRQIVVENHSLNSLIKKISSILKK